MGYNGRVLSVGGEGEGGLVPVQYCAINGPSSTLPVTTTSRLVWLSI